MIRILLNFVLLLFISIIVPTTGLQIKFHLQNIYDNASLNVQLLQKEIFETFSKGLPSSTNLETLAEQLADQLSGLDHEDGFKVLPTALGLEL